MTMTDDDTADSGSVEKQPKKLRRPVSQMVER